MRGSDEGTGALFSYVDIEARIRRDHPLRQIRQITNTALSALDGSSAPVSASFLIGSSVSGCRARKCCSSKAQSACRVGRDIGWQPEGDASDGNLEPVCRVSVSFSIQSAAIPLSRSKIGELIGHAGTISGRLARLS